MQIEEPFGLLPLHDICTEIQVGGGAGLGTV